LQAPLDHSFQNPPSSFNQNEEKNVIGGEGWSTADRPMHA
jgi:hypothetical protein